MPDHPIFDLISNGDLEAVKTRVLADPAVLERRNWLEMTPLICRYVRVVWQGRGASSRMGAGGARGHWPGAGSGLIDA